MMGDIDWRRFPENDAFLLLIKGVLCRALAAVAGASNR